MLLELPDSGGLKYSFIIRPGADYEQIKLHYVNADPETENGGLLINTNFESFTDRPPSSTVNGLTVETHFEIRGDMVSFELDDYDHTQTLIIDPWFETDIDIFYINKGFEIEFDYDGRVTVIIDYGRQLARYSDAGILEWVWVDPDFLGYNSFISDLDVNPNNGDIYYLQTFVGDLFHLNSDGVLIDQVTFDPYDFEDIGEPWRLYYNKTYSEIWVGGGGPVQSHDIARFNADLSDPINFDPMNPGVSYLLDMALIEMNETEDTLYFLSCSYFDQEYNNELICVTRDDPETII